MFLQIKNSKILAAILGLVFLVTIFTTALPVKAAEFYPKNDQDQNVEITATRDNVYAISNEISVKDSVARDLILAGSSIKITGNVGRSIIAAGNEINIDSNRVGGATRVTGNKVTISGNFGEELIVAASEVVIEDANINGDLIIATNKLTIKNSKILGDAKLSYTTLDGDLQAQILGKLDTSVNKEENFYSSTNLFEFLATQLSVIVFLLIVSSILSRRNSLHLADINLKSEYWKHLGIGLGFAILTLPIFIIASVVQLYMLALVVTGLIYLGFILSSFFFPIYLANLIKNTAKLDIKISNLVVITYLIIAILSFIPVINVITFIILFFPQSANFGYLVSKLYKTIFNSLPAVTPKIEMVEIKINDEVKSNKKEVHHTAKITEIEAETEIKPDKDVMEQE